MQAIRKILPAALILLLAGCATVEQKANHAATAVSAEREPALPFPEPPPLDRELDDSEDNADHIHRDRESPAQEIAERREQPIGTVSCCYHRGIQKLRQQVETHDG